MVLLRDFVYVTWYLSMMNASRTELLSAWYCSERPRRIECSGRQGRFGERRRVGGQQEQEQGQQRQAATAAAAGIRGREAKASV